jgi:hypothetical protein
VVSRDDTVVAAQVVVIPSLAEPMSPSVKPEADTAAMRVHEKRTLWRVPRGVGDPHATCRNASWSRPDGILVVGTRFTGVWGRTWPVSAWAYDDSAFTSAYDEPTRFYKHGLVPWWLLFALPVVGAGLAVGAIRRPTTQQ